MRRRAPIFFRDSCISMTLIGPHILLPTGFPAFYFVPCTHPPNFFSYNAQLRVFVFIPFHIGFFGHFGVDFPLVVEPSATGG
jgi:hypothetical protein